MSGWDGAAKAIWNSKVPTKVCFFAWAASKGKIPTEDRLKRKKKKLALVDVLCVWRRKNL